MNPLLTLSATALARMVREREVTSLELVETHIRQIERTNPHTNAMVRDRFDDARREAHLADERVRGGWDDLPPLWGVPCSIKESFAVTGLPNTGGLYARRNHVADKDAVTVARLRKAGAIPLGVTNVSELCMWMETSNTIYGRSRNPYDKTRIVGGSSGGDAALVGSAGAPIGLGADIGGSIRMPAFFNGIFGHKATGGTVPNSGQFPISHGKALRYLATGPFARRAEDLMPLLRILAGPDGEDSGCEHRELGDPAAVDFGKLTVIDVPENGTLRVSDDLRAAQKRAIEALRARGATIESASFPLLERSLEIWSSMIRDAGGPSFASLMGNGREMFALPELVKWMFGQSNHTFIALGTVMIERIERWRGGGRMQKALELGAQLRQELVDRIGDGVMLYPSYPHPAPRHHRPLFPPFQWTYTAIMNVMELPATQVPLGLNERGLPLGVQVVAKHGNDHKTIAVAMELERAFGGWVPPKIAHA